MDGVKQTYIYSSVVSDNSAENDFFVEFFPYEDDVLSNPSVITKNFDELLEFLNQYDED